MLKTAVYPDTKDIDASNFPAAGSQGVADELSTSGGPFPLSTVPRAAPSGSVDSNHEDGNVIRTPAGDIRSSHANPFKTFPTSRGGCRSIDVMDLMPESIVHPDHKTM